MASLAGKADPTIARMAYAAGMANVPGDYSEHYQSTVDAHKELMGGIEEIAAGIKLENDLATLEFKKAMKIFEDPLNLQMIDSDYTEMQADITAQREEWKANKGFKNDPEGRQDWDRRNQQIIGRHEQDNANLGTLQAGIDGNLYSMETMEINKKKYLTYLAKYQANRDKQSGIHNADATKYMKDHPNATPAQLWKKLGIVKEGVVVKFKDPVTGEYTYVSKVGEDPGTKEPLFESQKSSELLDYVNKDARADDTLVKAQALYQDRLKISNGRSDDYSGFRNEDRNALEELLDTDMLNNPNTLKYMMHKKIGGEKLSFAEALRSGKALGLTDEIIIALGATKSDGNDILEESDFATAESYDAVVNNILSGKAIYQENGKNKSLDTKGMYLDYTVDNAFKTGYNTYKKDETPQWKIPGTPEWERVRKANLKSNPPAGVPPFKDIYYGPKGNNVQGQTLNNIWSMLDGGVIKIDDIPYNRNKDTNAWINSVDQTEMSGNEVLKLFQKQAKGYQLMQDPNFKNFSGATTSDTYTMPKDQELTVTKLWNNAASGASGSSEKFAVSTLNTTFGGGFTQEDAGNKWTIGYGVNTYNLKNPKDKDLLLKAIKAQKVIDNS